MAGKRRRRAHRNVDPITGLASFLPVVQRPVEVLIFSLGDTTVTYTSTDPAFLDLAAGFMKGMSAAIPGLTTTRLVVPLRDP